MSELTRGEFIEQVTALERRLNERFDLLERLVALGFDDTTDQLRLRFAECRVRECGVQCRVRSAEWSARVQSAECRAVNLAVPASTNRTVADCTETEPAS